MDAYTQVAQADPGTSPTPAPEAPAAAPTDQAPAATPAAAPADGTPPAPAGAAPAAAANQPATAVAPPTNGQNVEVTVHPGQVIDLQIQAATAVTLVQDGDTLVINFGPQGNVVLHDFFPAAASANPPVLQVGENTQIPIGDIIAAIQAGEGALLEPAAGPAAAPGPAAAAANGGFAVTPVSLSSLSGIGLATLLGPTGLQFSVPEVEPSPLRTEGEETAAPPPGLTAIVVTDIPDHEVPTSPALPPTSVLPPGEYVPPAPVFGNHIGVGFEDWQPNQHLGDETENKMQLVISFTPSANETITTLTVSGLPTGSYFYIGDTKITPSADGTVTGIPAADIDHLFILPPKDSDADIPLTVTADLSNGNTLSTTITAVIDAVADHPDLEVVGTVETRHCIDGDAAATDAGREHQPVSVHVTAEFGDATDGSETHTVVVSNVPSAWTLTSGAPDGLEKISGSDGYDTYTFTVPNGQSAVNVTLNFDPGEWSSEKNNDGDPVAIEVSAVAHETISDPAPDGNGELTYANNTSVTVGTAEITLHEDTPTFEPKTATTDTVVDEGDLPGGNNLLPHDSTTVSGEIAVQFYTDGGEGTKVLFSQDTINALESENLTSCGKEIHYIISTDGTTIVAYTGEIVTSYDQITDSTAKIFTVTINQDSEVTGQDGCGDIQRTFTYDFQLEGTLTHSESGKDSLDLDFKVTAIDDDSDHSVQDGTFTVKVIDDVPTALDTALVEDETPGVDAGTNDVAVNNAAVVDAVSLAQDAHTSGETLVAIGAAQITPEFSIGAEALREIGFSGITTGDSANVTTSGTHEAVTYVVVSSSLILGVTGYDAGTGSYTSVAFSMHLDDAATFREGNGEFTFVQYEALDHPVAGSLAADVADEPAPQPVPEGSFNEGLSSLLSVGYTVTDCDGDTASAKLTVDVLDDGPAAHNDTALVQEGDTGGVANTVSGNVVTALGGDEAANAPNVPSADSNADSGGADQIQAITKIVSGENVYELSEDGNSVAKNGGALGDGESYDSSTGLLTLKSALGGTLSIDLKGDGVGAYTYTAPEHLDHSADLVLTPNGQVPDGIVITAYDDLGNSSTAVTNVDSDNLAVFEGTVGGVLGFGVTSSDDGEPIGGEQRYAEVNFTGNAGTSGTEALSFDFTQYLANQGVDGIKSMTIELGAFYINEGNGSTVYNEIGKYELYDENNNKVGEGTFEANSASGQYTLEINSTEAFSKVVLSVLQGVGADGDGVHHDNSDFIVTSVTVTGCVSQIDDTFTYTVQDNDNDTSDATLTIGVTDGDIRDVGVQAANPDSQNYVQEAHLADGSDPNAGTPPAAETATGTLVGLDWGPDGAGSIHLALPEATMASLTSDGQPLHFASIYDPISQVATFTATDHNGNGVFTLTLDAAGNYALTLTGVLDHPLTDATGAADSIPLDFTYTLKDSDACANNIGQPGHIVIGVWDDGPHAVDDTGKVNVGETLTVTAADGVLSNDSFGADGGTGADGAKAVTGVGVGEDGTPTAANIGQPIVGTYGTLTLNADGSYSYTPNASVTGHVDDKFTYQITDGDGDTTTAVLTVTTNPPPTISVTADAGATFTLSTYTHDFGELQPFPGSLPERQEFGGNLNQYGVPDAMVVDHYTAAITVTYVASVAGYENTLGYYIINADGTISDPQIIFPQASGDGNPLEYGNRVAVINNGGEGFDQGTAVGFFLIQDGHTDYGDLLTAIANGTAAGHLEFQEVGGGQASVESSTPVLVWVPDNGDPVIIDEKIWHTADATAGLDLGGTHYNTLGLNNDTFISNANTDPETNQHDLMGYVPGATDVLQLTFEDESFDEQGASRLPSDRDFNDLTFNIKFGQGIEYQVTSHFDLSFAIDDDTHVLGSMVVAVGNSQVGDQLAFSTSDYTLSGTNEVQYQGVGTGVTLTETDGTHWSFTAASGVSAQTFQDIANAMTLEHSANDGISREITVSVTDTEGLSAQTTHDYVVWNDPVESGQFQFDGTSGNDILIGMSHDQTISGGAGDDVLFGGTGAHQTLDGGSGNDILVCSSSATTLVWHSGDEGTAANPAVDTVSDFKVGTTGDKLDIHELLSDYHNTAGANLDNYVTAAKTGNNITLSIDVDGQTNGSAAHQEIVLQNIGSDVTATSSHDIVAELQAKQNLIV